MVENDTLNHETRVDDINNDEFNRNIIEYQPVNSDLMI